MKRTQAPLASKRNGMTAEISKDVIHSEMEGIKTSLEPKDDSLNKEIVENASVADAKNDNALEVLKRSGRADISDDIEKDINIDVNINNNTSSPVQYTSSITINYYNYESCGQTDSKAKPKTFLGELPPEFNSKLDELKTSSGLNENELAQMAYELLTKKFDIKQQKNKT